MATVIQIKGQPVQIKLTINAMVKFEEATGKSITAIEEDMGIKDMRALFHVCLCSSNYSCTEDEAGEIMGQYIEKFGMDKFGKLLSGAMKDSLGKSKIPEPAQTT